ncbi:hypothetical protein Bequi_09280 [Brachybacterium sp. JHP9]|uniref:Addiction module protein n=1 Tax=Brachybacterium equifaecis TaxID=2910770 RepID=A0ABT0R278_9MICO|nr:hypothetical protein [Brachybacterium equifaecis]MCL6423573.1 hypothetical protein [Brachybacterium equifaecis]
MSNTMLTADAPVARTRPDFTHVSDVMLYDIARHTASLLIAELIARADAATDESDQEQWEARLRLVDEQVSALNPDDRAGLIAQNEAWDDESHALRDRA